MKKLLLTLVGSILLSHAVFADNRNVLIVTAEQRDALLKEMRSMLSSSQQVLEGVVTDNMEMVEKAARTSGMKMARATPADLRKILPKGFKALGPLTHKGFEKIANEADGFGDTKKILAILAETQKSCVACHQSYQLQVGK